MREYLSNMSKAGPDEAFYGTKRDFFVGKLYMFLETPNLGFTPLKNRVFFFILT